MYLKHKGDRKMKTITLCHRSTGNCCVKLTLPVIEGKTYKPTDVFFLKDDYGNECKLTYKDLHDLAKVTKDL